MKRTVNLRLKGRNRTARQRDGNRLAVEQVVRPTLDALLDGLPPLDREDGSGLVDRPPPDPVDL